MSKVLFLVNHDVVIYNFRLEIVERLLAEGHEVIVSSPYGERIEILKKLGCIYKNVDLARHGLNPFHELNLIFYYKKLIKEVQPDIVFSFTIKPNMYGGLVCGMMRVPLVANITGLGTAIENGGFLKKILTFFYKISFLKVQRVFVQNKKIQEFFINNNIAVKKLKLLPGSGVNLERFYFTDYPENNNIIHFYFIGRIMRDKGIDEYLEAAKIIKNKYQNTVFHVCGFLEPEYQGKFNEYCDKKIIEYHGNLSDLHDIYKKSHCIILPTYHEGMSNVLQEAAAMGRPVLASNIPGCKEIIDEGKSGFCFEPKNTQSLINAIERFINLPYEKKCEIGLHGRKKMENEFNRQIVVNAYINEIGKIIKGN